MSRIVIPLQRTRDGDLAKTGNNVLSSIKGNALFPDTTLVQELEKALSEYQVALNDAADGGRTLISIKKDKRKALIEVLRKLVFYVSQVCNGDRTMLLSSGFTLAKDRGTTTPMSAIESMTAVPTGPGEMYIRVKKVAGARAYVHQYTTEQPTAATVWVSETTAHRTHTFKGLKPLVIYWFRVIAVGLNGQSVISDPVARAVL